MPSGYHPGKASGYPDAWDVEGIIFIGASGAPDSTRYPKKVKSVVLSATSTYTVTFHDPWSVMLKAQVSVTGTGASWSATVNSFAVPAAPATLVFTTYSGITATVPASGQGIHLDVTLLDSKGL